MPPEGQPLTAEQIKTLKAWIDQGATFPATRSRSPIRAITGRFARRCGRPCRRKSTWGKNPIDAFIAAEWQEARPDAAAAGRQALAAAPRLSRSDRPAADARSRSTRSSPTHQPTLTRRSSIGCSPARSTASAGAGTGWTSGATATGGAWAPRSATARSTSGTGATGSSKSLNADKGYDQMIREMLAADELYPDRPRQAARHRLPGPAVLQLQPHHLAGRNGRAHGQGVPRPDDQLRQVPRPQVRPDRAGGLLPLPRLLRAVPGAHRHGAGRGRLREGRPPAGVRLQPRRADVSPSPRRRPQPDHVDEDSRRACRPCLAGELKIDPVKLPPEAHAPHLRPFVEENYLKAAQARIAMAREAVTKAKSALARGGAHREDVSRPPEPKKESPMTAGKLIAKDDFAKANADLWDIGPGKWKYEKGRAVADAARRGAQPHSLEDQPCRPTSPRSSSSRSPAASRGDRSA